LITICKVARFHYFKWKRA